MNKNEETATGCDWLTTWPQTRKRWSTRLPSNLRKNHHSQGNLKLRMPCWRYGDVTNRISSSFSICYVFAASIAELKLIVSSVGGLQMLGPTWPWSKRDSLLKRTEETQVKVTCQNHVSKEIGFLVRLNKNILRIINFKESKSSKKVDTFINGIN